MGAAARHILVVDDDPDIRDLLHEVLADEGYRVSTAEGAEVAEVARLGPDLVVLDLVIGGRLTGLVAVEALRADPSTADIPVLLCTAAVREVEAAADRLAELDVGVVLKPFDLDGLLAAVRGRL